ncbi:MAG: signal peptidase II [Clostridia bacterium]|jgi:signal peptidase II|nr:signal peptidase II [Clostridia bacterium]MBQ6001212.1 signal peptidase II [Clostridia bacterium]MBQ6059787.1 signal peptidase II [Clostridia bacterium]
MKRSTFLITKAVVIIASVFALDRLVKHWCISTLRPIGSLAVWPNVLSFTYAQNTGAAFSMLSGKRTLLTVLPIAAFCLLVWLYLKRVFAHPLTDLAFPLIMGGAIGNLYDRILYGYVVDFIEIRLFRFAIFNVADCAISIGSALLILYLVLNWRALNESDPLNNTEGGQT